jgi:hypothetical protein
MDDLFYVYVSHDGQTWEKSALYGFDPDDPATVFAFDYQTAADVYFLRTGMGYKTHIVPATLKKHIEDRH